ncbi:hypothetical protein A3A66_04490 [Microgenomates group bacterium RIFCSPLOWO2_01_FULL_46_13]|nr:MAG: hypothetical protein A2783_04960 [Microgenomates group bacterium RIFCSPHIGHO2_01_FULL_45_11]OGV94228.1 MAG: hypothetical protein A3A66_04490 [Microgenomates group bacterium RIFCSPLOWO2_01_FULL_46_13]
MSETPSEFSWRQEITDPEQFDIPVYLRQVLQWAKANGVDPQIALAMAVELANHEANMHGLLDPKLTDKGAGITINLSSTENGVIGRGRYNPLGGRTDAERATIALAPLLFGDELSQGDMATFISSYLRLVPEAFLPTLKAMVGPEASQLIDRLLRHWE